MAPTEKQIKLVEDICRVCQINNFPISSKEFTKWHYNQFIQFYIQDYKDYLSDNILDVEYCYELCENDAWCEYY